MEKIALVVGTGAVENGWLPILTTLGKHSGYIIDPDGANCYFARLVYLMRFYATGKFPEAKENSLIFTEVVNKIKSEISEALLFAEKNNQIKARKELKDILYRFVFSTENQSVFITTNWDTVIDNAINEFGESNHPKSGSNIQSFHLHGSIKSPNSLYLPSEVVREPYRTQNEDTGMGSFHGTVWRAIEESNKTILYGLSLDPLDAELSQTLASGWSSCNLREIMIINPDHKKVAQRVRLLMDSRFPAKIIGYCPSNLKDKYEY